MKKKYQVLTLIILLIGATAAGAIQKDLPPPQDLNLKKSFTVPGTSPNDIAYDDERSSIWISDVGENKIYEVDTNGTLLGSFNYGGTGHPNGVTAVSERLFIGSSTGVIHQYTKAGVHVKQFDVPENPVIIALMAMRGTGLNAIVALLNDDTIKMVDFNGTLLLEQDISYNATGHVGACMQLDEQGTFFWAAIRANPDLVYKMDEFTQEPLIAYYTPNNSSNTVGGIDYMSSHLWSLDTVEKKIYKSSTLDPGAPNPPQNFICFLEGIPNTIWFIWDDPEADPPYDRLRLYRDGELLVSIDPGVEEYIDETVEDFVKYTYYMTSYNSVNGKESDPSQIVYNWGGFKPQVLIADIDDDSKGNEQYYQEILDDLGLIYYTSPSNTTPQLVGQYAAFDFKHSIIALGNENLNGITENFLMMAYDMENVVTLIGDGFLNNLTFEPGTVAGTYFKINGVGAATGEETVSGELGTVGEVDGSPLQLNLSGGTGADNQQYGYPISGLDPPAQACYKYPGNKIAGVQIVGDYWRGVLLSFALEAANNYGDRKQALQNILGFMDGEAPVVELEYPPDGIEIVDQETLMFKANANDEGLGLSKLEFSTDGGGTWVEADQLTGTYPFDLHVDFNYTWSVPEVQADYTILARAIDRGGLTGESDSITVHVRRSSFTPTPTNTPTKTPTPTPIPPKPVIALAGYMDTRITEAGGGEMLQLLAYCSTPATVDNIEIYFMGSPTGIELDLVDPVGVYLLAIAPIAPGIPAGYYPLDLKVTSTAGRIGWWPALSVEE